MGPSPPGPALCGGGLAGPGAKKSELHVIVCSGHFPLGRFASLSPWDMSTLACDVFIPRPDGFLWPRGPGATCGIRGGM
jgi:hypothetical protein